MMQLAIKNGDARLYAGSNRHLRRRMLSAWEPEIRERLGVDD